MEVPIAKWDLYLIRQESYIILSFSGSYVVRVLKFSYSELSRSLAIPTTSFLSCSSPDPWTGIIKYILARKCWNGFSPANLRFPSTIRDFSSAKLSLEKRTKAPEIVEREVKKKKKRRKFLYCFYWLTLLFCSIYLTSLGWERRTDYRTLGCWNENRLLIELTLLINIEKGTSEFVLVSIFFFLSLIEETAEGCTFDSIWRCLSFLNFIHSSWIHPIRFLISEPSRHREFRYLFLSISMCIYIVSDSSSCEKHDYENRLSLSVRIQKEEEN